MTAEDVVRRASDRLEDADVCTDSCVALAAIAEEHRCSPELQGLTADVTCLTADVTCLLYRMFCLHKRDPRFCLAMLECIGSLGGRCGGHRADGEARVKPASCAYLVFSEYALAAVTDEAMSSAETLKPGKCRASRSKKPLDCTHALEVYVRALDACALELVTLTCRNHAPHDCMRIVKAVLERGTSPAIRGAALRCAARRPEWLCPTYALDLVTRLMRQASKHNADAHVLGLAAFIANHFCTVGAWTSTFDQKSEPRVGSLMRACADALAPCSDAAPLSAPLSAPCAGGALAVLAMCCRLDAYGIHRDAIHLGALRAVLDACEKGFDNRNSSAAPAGTVCQFAYALRYALRYTLRWRGPARGALHRSDAEETVEARVFDSVLAIMRLGSAAENTSENTAAERGSSAAAPKTATTTTASHRRANQVALNAAAVACLRSPEIAAVFGAADAARQAVRIAALDAADRAALRSTVIVLYSINNVRRALWPDILQVLVAEKVGHDRTMEFCLRGLGLTFPLAFCEAEAEEMARARESLSAVALRYLHNEAIGDIVNGLLARCSR